jgi:uncharacterized protein YkwD
VDAELRHAVLAIALVVGCDASEPERDRDATLPDVEFCAGVQAWPDTAPEDELLAAITAARAEGGRCGTLGRAAPAPEPHTNGALTCAARVHALAMADGEFLDHEDPEGRLPWHRIADAGYESVLATELVARGELTPEALVEELWLPSDPHCGALLAAQWTDVGIARHAVAEPPPDPDTPAPTWWVVVLAMPDAPP